jgi:hypothetical protein
MRTTSSGSCRLCNLSNSASSFCIGETEQRPARLVGLVEIAMRDAARHAHEIAGLGLDPDAVELEVEPASCTRMNSPWSDGCGPARTGRDRCWSRLRRSNRSRPSGNRPGRIFQVLPPKPVPLRVMPFRACPCSPTRMWICLAGAQAGVIARRCPASKGINRPRIGSRTRLHAEGSGARFGGTLWAWWNRSSGS